MPRVPERDRPPGRQRIRLAVLLQLLGPAYADRAHPGQLRCHVTYTTDALDRVLSRTSGCGSCS